MAKVGRPKNPPPPKKMLNEVFPLEDIFSDKEIKLYKQLVKVYMEDFDADDLTASDMDDIFELARNKVLEFRLLQESKDNSDRQLDVAAAVEKLGKKNDKIKENLSARRRDRINPNEFKGFSIVDLAAAFNNDKKIKLREKAEQLKKEEEELLAKRSDYTGNKYDVDVEEKDKGDE